MEVGAHDGQVVLPSEGVEGGRQTIGHAPHQGTSHPTREGSIVLKR